VTFVIGTPHAHNAGYYRNDDRCSGGKLSEADIRTCPHCQALINMQAWKDDGGFCRRCDAPVCAHCATRALTYGCEPFLKRLDQFTDALVKYQSYIKMAGLDPDNPPSILLTGL
jgi:hypothetical protein